MKEVSEGGVNGKVRKVEREGEIIMLKNKKEISVAYIKIKVFCSIKFIVPYNWKFYTHRGDISNLSMVKSMHELTLFSTVYALYKKTLT